MSSKEYLSQQEIDEIQADNEAFLDELVERQRLRAELRPFSCDGIALDP